MPLNALPADFETSEGPTEQLFDEVDDTGTMTSAGLRSGRRNWYWVHNIVKVGSPSIVPPDNIDPVKHAVYALPSNIRVAQAMLIEIVEFAAWADKRFVFNWKVHNQSRHADHEISVTLTWEYTTTGHAPVKELQALALDPLLIGPGRWKQAKLNQRYHEPFQSYFDFLARPDIQAVFDFQTIRRK